jgi:hypothetical protein
MERERARSDKVQSDKAMHEHKAQAKLGYATGAEQGLKLLAKHKVMFGEG